jgi:succinoglycan biosynthesis transport protein ExoP
VEASPVIQGLRLREEGLSRELSAGLVEYGPRHPVIQNLRENLRGIQASIASEEARIRAKLESAVRSARQREAQLDRSLEALTSKAGEINAQLVEVRALERQVAARRTLLESFLARAQETDRQEGIQSPDARIISQADMPDAPSFPNTMLFGFAAFCGSGFLGVVIAFITQSLDTSFRTAEQVREALKVPLVEIVPRLRGRYGKSSPVDSVIDRPNGHFAEVMRNLYMTVFMVEERPKVVQFASSLPGEGKTSMVLSFGRFIASTTHDSVIVIDGDLRKSSVHCVLGVPRSPGLVDYLEGKATLAEVVQVDERSRMRYIASGSSTINPTHHLGSPLMQSAIAELREIFDVILLDTTPALAVADLRAVQPYVDATVFVVRWRATPRSAVNDAMRVLKRSNKSFSVSGALFNAVDVSDYKNYDSTYSYGLVNSYYRD